MLGATYRSGEWGLRRPEAFKHYIFEFYGAGVSLLMEGEEGGVAVQVDGAALKPFFCGTFIFWESH